MLRARVSKLEDMIENIEESNFDEKEGLQSFHMDQDSTINQSTVVREEVYVCCPCIGFVNKCWLALVGLSGKKKRHDQ